MATPSGNQETTGRESYIDELRYFSKLFERPTRREVLTQLATIDVLWRNIGDALGVSYNVLQGLAQSNMLNQSRLDHVIQSWFDMNGQDEGAPVTWTTILDVIKGPLVQNNALAMKINQYLKQQSDHRHFDKAIKSGSVKARISKAIVQGPARAGKTSVKCLVLRQRYVSNESTSAIESPQIAVYTGEFSVTRFGKSDDGVHWELVDSKRMVRKFVSEIRSLIAKIPKNEEDSSPSPELLEEDIFDDEMKLSDLVSKAEQLETPLTLHKEWLYFIDCGGQIQFQQLVQAFIPCASVLLLVTDLSKALSSQSSAVFQYAEGEDSTIQVSDYLPSVDTLLRRLTLMVSCDSFQSHSAGASALSDKIEVPEQLKVVAIATHRDIYEDLQRRGEEIETIQQKEEKLLQIFQPIMCKLSRYERKVLYQVDGRNAEKGVFDDPSVKEIRAELRDQAFEVNIPLSWYAFEIMLREKASCGILSLETCKTIGAKINLVEAEVQSALKFFHLLNTILYYPGVSNLVFVKPESLIDVIHELMVYICKRRENVKIGRETQDMIEAAEKGFVTKNVFKNFKKCKKILDSFSNFSSELLQIFQHLLIATEMPGDKFFMPALLPLTDPSRATSSYKSSLLYYFDKGVPLGLFCAMIVNLLSCRIDTNKRFCDNSVWTIDPTSTVYSNQVTLKYHKIKWRNVVFVESNDCYEIYFEHVNDKKIGEEAIECILDDTITSRKFTVSPVKAIFCPCSFEQSRHFAIEHECNQFVCTKSGNPSTEKDVNDMSSLKGVIEIPQQPLTHRETLIPQQSDTTSADFSREDSGEQFSNDSSKEKDTTSVVSSCEDNEEPSLKDSAKKKCDVEMTTPPSTRPPSKRSKQEEIIDTTSAVSSCGVNEEPSSKDSAKKKSCMGEEYRSNSLEMLLDQQPDIKELTTHVRTGKWRLLGVQLELDSEDLRECTDLTSMYLLWIQQKAEMASRRNLLTALRSIRENNVAWTYESYLRTLIH